MHDRVLFHLEKRDKNSLQASIMHVRGQRDRQILHLMQTYGTPHVLQSESILHSHRGVGVEEVARDDV
jgi:hypothetical protein